MEQYFIMQEKMFKQVNDMNEKANTNLDDVDIEDSFSNKQGLPGIVSPPASDE